MKNLRNIILKTVQLGHYVPHDSNSYTFYCIAVSYTHLDVYKRQVYYVIDNKEVVSMETHRFPFSITLQRSAANVRHVLINVFNVKKKVWYTLCTLMYCTLTHFIPLQYECYFRVQKVYGPKTLIEQRILRNIAIISSL